MNLYIRRVNSLPNDKILDLSKLTAFAEDNLKMAQRNIEGKEKILVTSISPFLKIFSWGFFSRVVKSRDCVIKG